MALWVVTGRVLLCIGWTAAAMLALPGFEANQVRAGDECGNSAHRRWFKQKAMQTGDAYYWDRRRRDCAAETFASHLHLKRPSIDVREIR